MPLFYITPTSISYLTELILASAISLYLLYRTRQGQLRGDESLNTFLLFGAFASLSVFILLTFLHGSLHPDLNLYPMPLMSVPAVVSLAFILQFAYRFPNPFPDKGREAKIVLWLCVLYVVWEILFAVYRYLYLLQGQVIYRLVWMDIPILIGFLWLAIVFIRQMKNASSSSTGVREVRTTRAFFLFSLIPLLLAINMLLRSYGVTPFIFSEIVLALGTLFLLVAFTVVYLNYLPEKSSFIVKLAGITLTTILAILGGVAWLISPAYIQVYNNDNIVQKNTTLRFVPNTKGGYEVTKSDFVFDKEMGQKRSERYSPIELGFDFPFYNKSWSEIYIREDGIVSFGEFPVWSDMRDRYGSLPAIFPLAVELGGDNAEAISVESGVYVKNTADKLVITWYQMPETNNSTVFYSFQLAINKKGVIEMSFIDLPEKYHHDISMTTSTAWITGLTPGGENRFIQRTHFNDGLPLTANANTALINDYYLDFRNYLNQVFIPLAYFILGSSFFTLISFPVLFRLSLVKPLGNLLRGVQRFRAGHFGTTLPVDYHDEIGYLTQSFNEMATTQRQLVENLEKRVAERTAEVANYAAENARFEERSRLSRDLHDAVSQNLFSAVLMTENLSEIWKQDPEQGKQILGELRELNQNALSEMRILLLELRSQAFTEEPFSLLIRQLTENMFARSEIEVSLEIESDCILPADVQTTFYRIAQESFNNINKHAKAHYVNLYFDCLSEQAILSISDDGCGFLMNSNKSNHLGLKIMQERAVSIGAILEVQSQPDQGSHITLVWNEQDAKSQN